MTSSEAMPLIRDLIARIPGLRHRPAYNAEYQSWEKEAVKVLAEGLDLSYLGRFDRFKRERGRSLDNYPAYLADLEKKRRLLDEIVATHGALICGAGMPSVPAVELRPEDMTALGVAPEEIELKLHPVQPELPPAWRRSPGEAHQGARAEAPEQPVPPRQPEVPGAQPELAAERALSDKITHAERMIEDAQRALARYRRELGLLARHKRLLSAEGEALEGVVAETLAGLGLEVARAADGGLVITAGGDRIPLEVASAAGPVPERPLRRLIGRLPDQTDDGRPRGAAARGVLVGSACLGAPLDTRLGQPCFEEGLVEQAASFAIRLLPVGELFAALTAQEAAPEDLGPRLLEGPGAAAAAPPHALAAQDS
jgi:hypothetical protein